MMLTMIPFAVWLTNKRRLALFPTGTIIRDSHRRESDTPQPGFEPAQNRSSGFDE